MTGLQALSIEGFEQILPDCEALRTHADALQAAGSVVEALADSTAQTWNRLQSPGVYSAPGQAAVFSAFEPVRTRGAEIATAAAAIGSALKGYAAEAEDIRRRFNTEVVPGAESFLADTAGMTVFEWDDDQDLVDRHEFLIGRMNALAVDLDGAQQACVSALDAVRAQSPVCAPVPEERSAPSGAAGLAAAYAQGAGMGTPPGGSGLTAKALAEAKPGELPWGWKVERDNGSSPLKKGAQDQIEGLADDTYTIFGGNGSAAQYELLQGSAFVFGAAFGGPRARGNQKRILEEMFHTELFKTDPLRALGRLTFDLGSILLPGGAAAKGGGLLRTGVHLDPDAPAPHVTVPPPAAPEGILNQENPEGAGRDPNLPPVPGDNDHGDGTWTNIKRQEAGAQYQEYISGVPRPGPGYMTEYVVPFQDGPDAKKAEFDGHFWRPGPPPEEVFMEAKGRYAWMAFPSPEDKLADRETVRTKLDYTIQQTWIMDQMQRQVLALKGNPNATLEWYVADKTVQEELQRQVDLDPTLAARVTIIHVDHP